MNTPDYYVYLLRCADGSLYTGIAADLLHRMTEHFRRDPKCARYTKSHAAVLLCAAWTADGRAAASRLEYRLKKLPKRSKEALAAGAELSSVLNSEQSPDRYSQIPREELASFCPSPAKNLS